MKKKNVSTWLFLWDMHRNAGLSFPVAAGVCDVTAAGGGSFSRRETLTRLQLVIFFFKSLKCLPALACLLTGILTGHNLIL